MHCIMGLVCATRDNTEPILAMFMYGGGKILVFVLSLPINVGHDLI